MATVNINLGTIVQRLQQIKQNIPDALMAAGVSLLNAASRNITTQNPPFAPWSEAYRKRTHAHAILWDTATLLRSLTPGGPQDILQSDGDSKITVGSNVKYAAYLNFGYRTNPERPFLYVNSERADDAKAAFLAQLMKGVM